VGNPQNKVTAIAQPTVKAVLRDGRISRCDIIGLRGELKGR
jgi:hypothetical protein